MQTTSNKSLVYYYITLHNKKHDTVLAYFSSFYEIYEILNKSKRYIKTLIIKGIRFQFHIKILLLSYSIPKIARRIILQKNFTTFTT